MKRKKLTSKQIIEAIIAHKVTVWYDADAELWTVDAGPLPSAIEEATLERAVYKARKALHLHWITELQKQEEADRAEYERLKAKYG